MMMIGLVRDFVIMINRVWDQWEEYFILMVLMIKRSMVKIGYETMMAIVFHRSDDECIYGARLDE
jgi:hypothetical protein